MKKIAFIFIALLIILSLPASLLAAQKTITTYTWDRNILVNPPGVGGGTPATPPMIPPDVPPPVPPVVNSTSTPSVTIDPVTGAIVMGNGLNNSSGAMWYGGTSPVGTCNPCNTGVCTFGIGFRAYFEFKFTTPDSSTNSTAAGDGFTFTIVNATNNDTSKRGGVPITSTIFTLGELLGYAGTGNTATTSSLPRANPPLDGLGLEPPKMALEFDTYPNTGAIDDNGCSGGRDDNNNSNHIALLFWGSNPDTTTMCAAGSTAGNTYPRASFDDNVHGAGTTGSTTVPRNSFSGDGTGGYFERARNATTGYNWLEDGAYHRARIEILRTPDTNTYQTKVWVDCESGTTSCPGSEYIYFQDVYNPYTNSSYLPKINRTQQLDAALNASFNNILFGFTEGTGAATQGIQITNFAIYFPTVAISPTSRAHTYSAISGQTVSVTAASTTCTWTAVSNNTSWLTVTGGASGTGNGTVTYSVAANTGAVRTGTITVGGQIFTVTQDAGPPSCTLTASANIVPYNGTTGLTWTVSGTATSATWTTSPGGTCGSPNPSGGSCTTAAQTTAGARTNTLTVTNAIGSSSCSTTVYVGCQNYQVWNQLGAQADFWVGTQCGNNINDNSEITSGSRRLDPGETVQQLTNVGTCGGTATGTVLNYNNAMNVDIVANGGNGNCRVNFTGNGTATDR